MLKQMRTNYLAKSVRDARREAGLTQHQLAEKAEISIQTIRRLEHGAGNLGSWDLVIDALGLELHGRTLPSGGTLGEQLATLLKRRGISQQDLCALIGVTQPTLIALERKGKGAWKRSNA